MTDPANRLDQLLEEHGRMNFHLDCTSAGLPARITMNEENVYVATTAKSAVVAMPFADVQVDGDELTRSIRNRRDGIGADITFGSAGDVDRFVRVLRVRQDGKLVHVPLQARPDPQPAAAGRRQRMPHGSGLRPADLPNLYRIWTDWALLASTFLLIVAWIDLAAGAILALALWLKGEGLAGLIWLLVAIAGFAMPFCLGALTRMVVYRFRIQDRAASARTAA